MFPYWHLDQWNFSEKEHGAEKLTEWANAYLDFLLHYEGRWPPPLLAAAVAAIQRFCVGGA